MPELDVTPDVAEDEVDVLVVLGSSDVTERRAGDKEVEGASGRDDTGLSSSTSLNEAVFVTLFDEDAGGSTIVIGIRRRFG
jgi:hypothetical protein